MTHEYTMCITHLSLAEKTIGKKTFEKEQKKMITEKRRVPGSTRNRRLTGTVRRVGQTDKREGKTFLERERETKNAENSHARAWAGPVQGE